MAVEEHSIISQPTPQNGTHLPYDSLLVIIPAFNEEKSVPQVVARVRRCAGRLSGLGLRLQVCVINDGSTDNTGAVARQAGADHILTHKLNRGLGAAVRSGLIYGRNHGFSIVVKLDADAQHDPSDIPALITPILNDQADVVYGNRFPQLNYRMPFIRRVGNTAFRLLMRWLTSWDIEDSQPGIFAVSDAYLKVFFIPGDYNYTQQILLDSYHKGMRFDQVPVGFKQRRAGSSFISLRYPLVTLPQILLLLLLIKPLRIFLPVAAFFIIAAITLFGVEFAMWLSGNAEKPVEHVNLVLGLAVFGLNTGYFGLLAEVIVRRKP